MKKTPILYSFRRCPYAIRARIAIAYAFQKTNNCVYLKEVSLKNKSDEFLNLSKKGTVPLLVCANNEIIDESIDIMHWALSINDEGNWLRCFNSNFYSDLIKENDFEFKYWLDRYKYCERYTEYCQLDYRIKAEYFLKKLELCLDKKKFLYDDCPSFCDWALMPFVRQFALVDSEWFFNSSYKNVQKWLSFLLKSYLFVKVFVKRIESDFLFP